MGEEQQDQARIGFLMSFSETEGPYIDGFSISGVHSMTKEEFLEAMVAIRDCIIDSVFPTENIIIPSEN